MKSGSGKEWESTHPGFYTRDGYSIMRAAHNGSRWILRLRGSVFGLRVPSLYETAGKAMLGAERDERIRGFTE